MHRSTNTHVQTYRLLETLCRRLGKLIDYKHKETSCRSLLVFVDNKEYDAFDLLEQVGEYLETVKEYMGAKE